MDLNNIAKLLPEFLGMFKGKSMGNLQDIMSSVGNTGLLEKFLGGNNKYAKYLPLLPLLANLNKDGFKGLLSNSESIAPLISSFTEGKTEKIAGLDISTITGLLPLLSGFLNKGKKEENIIPAESVSIPVSKQEESENEEEETDESTAKKNNPLAPISEIADRDIIYLLNKYISNN